ncbi:hypothetical protein N7466_009610 [Penicillium verhagenii]|uniref:uncharacterized protein n=1 Tax=Penicillium verhagenii TaxID=1562060 RepID=UPI002544E013|nr:uncharacterized protein N7466_009610 [Penicillium verhagenii]KAJ5921284.1 hypothetical protein N7466_009610 [Penicillium verhagenii]
MFKIKSQKSKQKEKQKQKQKQKERQTSVSSGVSYSGTKNSSSTTLPVQASVDWSGAMKSTPSLVTPELKPEAPVLSEPDVSTSPKQAFSVPAPVLTTTPPLPRTAPIAPSEPILSVQPDQTVSAPAPASPVAFSSPPQKQAPVAFEPPTAPPTKPAHPASPKYKAFVEAEPEPEITADNTSPPSSMPSESRPVGGRRGKSDEDANGTRRGGELVAGKSGVGGISTAGLQIPGELLNEDEKSALKIKIHLNLHAKVRLDLDAQIYGDVVIGLM